MKTLPKKLLAYCSLTLGLVIASNLYTDVQAGCCPYRSSGASNYADQCAMARQSKDAAIRRRHMARQSKLARKETEIPNKLNPRQLPKEQALLKKALNPRRPKINKSHFKNRR